MKKTIQILSYFLLILFFFSCYSYGPIHAPYTNNQGLILPPPPQKVKAVPLTKKEYIDKVYQELASNISEAEVTLINDSIKVLFPNNIIYISKQIYPIEGFEAPLQRFSQLLNKYTKTNILITGHTDNKGTELKNKEISLLRANNIKYIINNNGIAMYRLYAWGMGSTVPLVDNFTEAGRAKNRRVEFVVLYQDQ